MSSNNNMNEFEDIPDDDTQLNENNSDLDDEEEEVSDNDEEDIPGKVYVPEDDDEEEINNVDDDDDIDDDDDTNHEIHGQIPSGAPTNGSNIVDEYLNDDDSDDEDENYFQKFDVDTTNEYIHTHHPEAVSHNFDEILKLIQVRRDIDNHIVDPCHKTIPFLTKFEKTRIIGQRAKQIETGSKPFVEVPHNIIDSYLIAELELQQRKIPFIIRRPLPDGTCEYWDVNDLENIYI